MTISADGEPKLRREFGKRARQSATERYGTQKIIPMYIAFYEKILDTARA